MVFSSSRWYLPISSVRFRPADCCGLCFLLSLPFTCLPQIQFPRTEKCFTRAKSFFVSRSRFSASACPVDS